MYPLDSNDLSELKLLLAEDLGTMVSWEYDVATDWIILSHDPFEKGVWLEPQGYKLNDLFAKYLNAQDIPMIRRAFKRGIVNGSIENVDIRIMLGNASYRDMRIEGRMLTLESGKKRMVGVFQDITDWLENQRKINNQLLFFDSLINNIPKPIFYQDLSCRIQHCNKSFLNFMGIENDQTIGTLIDDIVDSKMAVLNRKYSILARKSRQRQHYQATIPVHGGLEREIHVFMSAVFDDDENMLGTVAIIEDLTDIHRSEERRRKLSRMKDIVLEINKAILDKTTLEDIFEYVLDRTIDSIDAAEVGTIPLLDKDGMLYFQAARGFDPESIRNARIPLEQSFQWQATNGELGDTLIMNHLDKLDIFVNIGNDMSQPIKSSISAPLVLDGELLGFLAIDSTRDHAFTEDDAYLVEYLRGQLINSISRFRLYENVLNMTERDAQTGLYNRRYFESIFEMTKERCLRYGEEFLFVVFDLDGLKKVNDTAGHLAGDQLIETFAGTLQGALRGSDILARTGGDEFTAVLFQCDADDVSSRLETLNAEMAGKPMRHEGHEIICSFSYGIAKFPDDGKTYDSLMEFADSKMYLYKKNAKRI